MVHPSHKTRYSDSSLYDEVCVACGANDGRATKTRLDLPCNYPRVERGNQPVKDGWKSDGMLGGRS